MSTTLEPPVTYTNEVEGPEMSSGTPQPYNLEERIPAWIKTRPGTLAWVLLVGLVFAFYSFQYLHYTDVWSHVHYGRVIWMTGAIPATEPLMRLSAGMPFVDTAWGSQVIGYLMHRGFGGAGLQFLHAACVSLAVMLVVRILLQRTRNGFAAFVGFSLFLTLSWFDNIVTRPQLAGVACYCGLLSLLLTRWSPAKWVLVPALFMTWANLHGSFVMGLGLCIAATLGRAIDVAWRQGRLMAVVTDRPSRRLLVLSQLAFLATLANPYGPSLYNEVLAFNRYSPLADLTEWQPLTLRSTTGQMVAVLSVLLMFAYRNTPRRVSTGELLALLGLTGAMLWSQRFLVWWTPVAVLALVIHAHAGLRAKAAAGSASSDDEEDALPARAKGVWTLCAVGLIWIFFAWTPFGLRLLHGEKSGVKTKLVANTPMGAIDWYRKNPPSGQIFNPMEWGDILAFSGPRGLQVFVSSQAHLVHPDIWKHYMSVINVNSGWDDLLDLYGVNSVILDKAQRQSLIGRIRDHDKWKVSYEDNTAVVFSRRTPI
jgi:hypothetical protein